MGEVVAEVLVVGAGPCGLVLAAELFRHGVPCRLIEASATPHEQSRATDLHPRTLEAMEQMGVLSTFMARGSDRARLAVHSGGRQLAEVDIRDADTSHPTMLGIAQSDSEEILAEHLVAVGGRVERGVSLVGLRQDGEGVEVELRGAEGAVEVARFGWVVGCDGAHSAVRGALGLRLEGSTFEESFFLVDVHFAEDGVDPRSCDVYLSSDGMVMFLPLPGDRVVRIFGDYEGDEVVDEAACLSILTRRTGLKLPPIKKIGWSALFRVHSRMVDRYRVGRVFVAGDAAHLHSPVGAHGMNTSVQDAFNLAWKLAWVCRGWSPQSLLDSYEAERLPVARRVLLETNLNTQMMLVRNGLMRRVMGAMTGLAMDWLTPMRRQLIAQTLELNVAYKPNPWLREHHISMLRAQLVVDPDNEDPCVGKYLEFNRGPGPGERAPDVALPSLGLRLFEALTQPAAAALLLFDGVADTLSGDENLRQIARVVQDRWPERLQVAIISPRADWPDAPATLWHDPDMAVHRRFGASGECLYLLRPDGYIGFRSQPASLEPLMDYLQALWI